MAVAAMKSGVTDYAVKGSADAEALIRAVENALEKSRVQRELERRDACTGILRLRDPARNAG